MEKGGKGKWKKGKKKKKGRKNRKRLMGRKWGQRTGTRSCPSRTLGASFASTIISKTTQKAKPSNPRRYKAQHCLIPGEMPWSVWTTLIHLGLTDPIPPLHIPAPVPQFPPQQRRWNPSHWQKDFINLNPSRFIKHLWKLPCRKYSSVTANVNCNILNLSLLKK